MSHTLDYREPHRLSAGLLALTVHVAFFTLLMVGVRWQSKVPEEFSVELWSTLPTVEVAPQQPPLPAPEVVQPAPAKAVPPPPVKADIELREKKLSRTEPPKPTPQEIRAARLEEEQRQLAEYAEKRRQTEQARVRAEVSAATAAEVGRYQDMIRSKIQRNIVMPPDVAESAKAQFRVTLLPDGSVLEAVLVKSSGNSAYDDAVERAIHKAEPLPMPKDVALQRVFRDLNLFISPGK